MQPWKVSPFAIPRAQGPQVSAPGAAYVLSPWPPGQSLTPGAPAEPAEPTEPAEPAEPAKLPPPETDMGAQAQKQEHEMGLRRS